MARNRQSRELEVELCPHCGGSGQRPTADSLAEYILAIRSERGMTVRAAAKLLGISPTHLSDIENSKRRPGADLLARIAAL